MSNADVKPKAIIQKKIIKNNKMGLDKTHNAWHGPYSSFNDFRRELLKAYNGMDLFQFKGYEGINRSNEKIEYKGYDLVEYIEDDGLLILLNHSDCEGSIRWVDCKIVASALKNLTTKVDTRYFHHCINFFNGCISA